MKTCEGDHTHGQALALSCSGSNEGKRRREATATTLLAQVPTAGAMWERSREAVATNAAVRHASSNRHQRSGGLCAPTPSCDAHGLPARHFAAYLFRRRTSAKGMQQIYRTAVTFRIVGPRSCLRILPPSIYNICWLIVEATMRVPWPKQGRPRCPTNAIAIAATACVKWRCMPTRLVYATQAEYALKTEFCRRRSKPICSSEDNYGRDLMCITYN